MPYGFLDIAVTPSVSAVQAKMGAFRIWQDFKGHREFDRFTESEAAFIADRDSFYLATVSETGWHSSTIWSRCEGSAVDNLKLFRTRWRAYSAAKAECASQDASGFWGFTRAAAESGHSAQLPGRLFLNGNLPWRALH